MPRSAAGALVLILVLLASNVAGAQPAIERQLAQAAREHERGRIERARRLWLSIARRAPLDGRAAIRLAELLPEDPSTPPTAALVARAREAERALIAHLDAAGENVRVRHLLAWAIAWRGDHTRAIEDVSTTVGLHDEPAAALLSRLAALAARRGDLRAAQRALEAAHRAVPEDVNVIADLGAVELALGEASRAVERFSFIAGRHPEDLSARRDLAGALVAAGRASEAVDVLARALERHPEEPDLALELATAALEAGQGEVAQQAARRAVERATPNDGRAHAVLGSALALMRRRSEAEQAFAEALRRDRNELRAQHGMEALRRGTP